MIYLFDSLIARSLDWLAIHLIDWLIVWLIDWFNNWLIDRLLDWSFAWLIDWLIHWLLPFFLSSQEGVHYGLYRPLQVDVTSIEGHSLSVRTYQMMRPYEENAKPSTVYKRVITMGARQSDLPGDYLQFIDSIPGIECFFVFLCTSRTWKL